jgi:hypothetical protein
MNNNNLRNAFTIYVLIPPTPFSCRQKKGEILICPSLRSREGLG